MIGLLYLKQLNLSRYSVPNRLAVSTKLISLYSLIQNEPKMYLILLITRQKKKWIVLKAILTRGLKRILEIRD